MASCGFYINGCRIVSVVFLQQNASNYIISTVVDGRNPAPPGMYKNPVNNGILTISTGAGLQPSTVSSSA